MSHDPLCPIQRETWCIWTGDKCEKCKLIAKAREDEHSNNFTPDDFAEAMTDAYRRGLDAARGVVTEQSQNRSGSDGSPAMYVWVPYLLAAIDALKEK